MKKFAVVALLATFAISAYAYTCNTHCYWIGNQQYCQTICN